MAEQGPSSYGISPEAWSGVDEESAKQRVREAMANYPESDFETIARHFGLDEDDIAAMLSDWQAVTDDFGGVWNG